MTVFGLDQDDTLWAGSGWQFWLGLVGEGDPSLRSGRQLLELDQHDKLVASIAFL